jgi:predicted O-linked N-acetylglucosamine transferase (SPINDLY family)
MPSLSSTDINAIVVKAKQYFVCGDLLTALGLYFQAIAIAPEELEYALSAALILGQLERYDEALLVLDRAKSKHPDSFEIWLSISLLAKGKGELSTVVGGIKKCFYILLSKNKAFTGDLYGSLIDCLIWTLDSLHRTEQTNEAENLSSLALIHNPSDHRSYTFMGLHLDHCVHLSTPSKVQFLSSISQYQRAIQIAPCEDINYYYLANSYVAINNLKSAVPQFERAIELNPSKLQTFNNAAVLYQKTGNFSRAIEYTKRCIFLEKKGPAFSNSKSLAGQYFNLGALHLLNFEDEFAKIEFERALEIDPLHPQLLGAYIHLRMKLCDWDSKIPNLPLGSDKGNLLNFKGLIDWLLKCIDSEKIVVHPFSLLSITDNPLLLQKAAQQWIRYSCGINHTVDNPSNGRSKKSRSEKIRIGFFSSDFKDHATAYLCGSFFELINKDEFEIYAYSWGEGSHSAIKDRLKRSFDTWREVHDLSDLELTRLARRDMLDVAVDLKGHTHGARTQVFVNKVAPVQIAYLGFPGTMGGSFMDYCIADQRVVNEYLKCYMSEKVINMSVPYQVNDLKQEQSAIITTKSQHNLPENAVVLCAMNSSYKITPDIFDLWLSILKSNNRAVLWLLSDSSDTDQRLRTRALQLGVDPERLIFSSRISHALHLERLTHADLFLDTFPCNGHTTTSDALWAGVPVVSISGLSFASRVSLSLVGGTGLNDLIFDSKEAYKAKILQLISDPAELKTLRSRLQIQRSNGQIDLFDTHKFVRDFESKIKSIVFSEEV